jgi:aryl-alcohol dehydrogenase-like predicted oxidoreductase
MAASSGWSRLTVPQLALAWLLAQGDDYVPIPGTRSRQRVVENVEAAIVVLTEAERARIRESFPSGAFGARYIDAYMPTWQ